MYLTDLLFCDKRKVKTVISGLNDTKRTKKKQVALILVLFTPSDLNDFEAQIDFGKSFVAKNIPTLTILILSML